MNIVKNSIRIHIVTNANQKIASIVMIDSEEGSFKFILKSAKNKLRLKNPTRLFAVISNKFIVEVNDDNDLKECIRQEISKIFVSSGEDYVGKLSVESFQNIQNETAPVCILCSHMNCEQNAFKQLEETAKLPGMIFCVGMPDIHAGGQYPVGAAFITKKNVYPALIGSDIGCGMTMFQISQSEMSFDKIIGKEIKIANMLNNIEGSWNGDKMKWLERYQALPTAFDDSLGTVGRGNHFAEIQVVHQVHDPQAFDSFGLSPTGVFLLVHSGSRGYGQDILNRYKGCNSDIGLVVDSMQGEAYMLEHDNACRWACCNRHLIAHRIFTELNLSTNDQHLKILDIWHNNVEKINLQIKSTKWDGDGYLHRKGAAPSDRGGLVVIPGSRGTLTYLCEPLGDQEANGWSVAHGAGRQISRQKILSKYETQYHRKELIAELSINQYGGVVICEDCDLLCEEAPDAYKDVDAVVQELLDRGIVRVVATLRPFVTYKMRKG